MNWGNGHSTGHIYRKSVPEYIKDAMTYIRGIPRGMKLKNFNGLDNHSGIAIFSHDVIKQKSISVSSMWRDKMLNVLH